MTMNLETTVQSLSGGYWLDEQEKIRRHQGRYQPTKAELKHVIAQVQGWLTQRKEGRATNWAALGLLLSPASFVAQVRKRGTLRASKYAFEACLGNLLRCLLDAILDLPEHIASYLRSVHVLSTVAADLRKKRNGLLDFFRRKGERALKGMLAQLDLMFLLDSVHGRDTQQKAFDSSDSRFFGAEEYGEGFSYAFHLYHEHFGSPRFAMPLEPADVASGAYLSYLTDASHIRAFEEIEVLVDCFDYSLALSRGSRVAALSPPSPDLEKAIRLGYMTIQASAGLGVAESLHMASIKDLAKELFEATNGEWVELRQHPFERYCSRFVAHPKLIACLQDPGLFKEEYNDLASASEAFFADEDELLSFEFTPHVRLWDLLRVQRLFNFMRFYLSHRLLGLRSSRPYVVLQSMVPVFTDSKLREFLGFVVPEFKASAIIQFLSWNSGSERHFDVQYQPIIRTEHEYLVPASVLGSSNSLRNSFQLCRKRLYPDGAHDPLSVALLNSFQNHTAYARANVKYSWKADSGELDVLALFDGRLFVVECKNSLLPTGPHELRTSYDYIQTAAEQLNRFSRVYGDPQYRDLLAKHLGWPITPSTRLVTCIVMSNRMFSGYRITKHAVRGAGEFTGFMSHGSVRLALEDCSESRCFWRGDKLTGEDLEAFIAGDLTYKARWDALEEYSVRHRFGTYAVDQVSYRMVALALARNLGFAAIAAGIETLERGEKGKGALEPSASSP